MNPGLKKLTDIAQKKERLILGMMSGTSLDGLDLALCAICEHGHRVQITVINYHTIAYSQAFRQALEKIAFQKNAPLSEISLWNNRIAWEHAQMIGETIAGWNIPASEIDLLASHGQTIYHEPGSKWKNQVVHHTLQIGDGDHLARLTGIICIHDFRQKHIAAGAEGAPLAAYGDFLLYADEKKDTLLINIGGISNFTYIPKGYQFSGVITGDAGPGNTLMDQWIRQNYPGMLYDDEGRLAASGAVQPDLLRALLQDPFFQKPCPKSTGPEHFNLAYVRKAMMESDTKHLSDADVMATLNRFTATALVEAIQQVKPDTDCRVLVSGGGKHNLELMNQVKKGLEKESLNFETQWQIPTDAKEAVLFALLANERICGDGKIWGAGAPGLPPVNLGKISLPD